MYIGLVIGYIIFIIGCHDNCYKFNHIKFASFTIHLHHWLICFTLLFLYTITCTKNIRFTQLKAFFKGVCIGGIVHGLLHYDDWYICIY